LVRNIQIFGWLIFILSAFAFIVSSWRSGDFFWPCRQPPVPARLPGFSGPVFFAEPRGLG
jgi:hypothetical protein